jgi:hypothetical protein
VASPATRETLNFRVDLTQKEQQRVKVHVQLVDLKPKRAKKSLNFTRFPSIDGSYWLCHAQLAVNNLKTHLDPSKHRPSVNGTGKQFHPPGQEGLNASAAR